MSGKLSCSAVSCVNNMNGLCSANSINVRGSVAHTSSGTECETFAQKGFMNAVRNLGNMNIAGEIRQLVRGDDAVEMSPGIRCAAVNCVYNMNRVCGASNVQIYGPGAATSEGTECETFREG
jgi:hypothetical protein